MQGIKVILSKELKRVFKDPKMLFSLFILPVVLMVGIYSLIGYLGSKENEATENHHSVVYIQNAPDDLQTMFDEESQNMSVSYLNSSDNITSVKDGIYNGTIDLLVVFPDNFTQQVSSYKEGNAIPDVQSFYNPSENYSQHARDGFMNFLNNDYQKTILAERLGSLDILTVFTVDSDNQDSIIQDNAKASGKMLSMMLPYLITILLFAGTMSLGTDAITGEKERGTMASMLVTPVHRSEIVLGKLLALTILSILSASVYVVALTVSLPKSMASMSGDLEHMGVTFSPMQIFMMAVIILTLAFLYVALVGIVSVFARTIKEASTYVTPLYLLVIVAGLFTMMSPSEGHTTVEYLIPIYNCSISLGEIFTGELTMLHFILTFGSTIVVGGVLTAVIAKAFGDERVMFNA